MGVDVQVYRSRIGTFRGGRSQKSHICAHGHADCMYKLQQCVRRLAVIHICCVQIIKTVNCFIYRLLSVLTKPKLYVFKCWIEKCSKSDVTKYGATETSQYYGNGCKNESVVLDTDCEVTAKTVEDNFCCFPEVQDDNVICDTDKCKDDLDCWCDSNIVIKYWNFKFCDDHMVHIRNCLVNDTGVKDTNHSTDDVSDTDRIDETTVTGTLTCMKSDTDEISDSCHVTKWDKHEQTECDETYSKADTNVNSGSCDRNERIELSENVLDLEANEVNECPSSNLRPNSNVTHELPTRDSESATFSDLEANEVNEQPTLNLKSSSDVSHPEFATRDSEAVTSIDHESSCSRSVTIIDRNDGLDTHASVPFSDNQATEHAENVTDPTEKMNEISVCDTKLNPNCSEVTESHLSRQLRVDQTTNNHADSGEMKHEVSACDMKPLQCSVVTKSHLKPQLRVDRTSYNHAGTGDKIRLQCSVVTKSQLTPPACKTVEEDDERRSIKDSIRRSTTPLEPFRQVSENFTVVPAFEPSKNEGAKELVVQRDSATNRTRNTVVVADAAPDARQRTPQNMLNISSSSSQHHSDQNIAFDGPRSAVFNSTPSSLTQYVTDTDKPTTSSLPVDWSNPNNRLQPDSDSVQPDIDGHSLTSLASSAVVEQSSSTLSSQISKPNIDGHSLTSLASSAVVEQSSSTLSSQTSKPNGAYGFESNGQQTAIAESNGQQTSIAETEDSFDGNVQQTNIAQPTSDQPTDTTRSSQSEGPRFEPFSAILHKLSVGDDLPPQETMRYEMLRLYTLHSYPRENKPYIIRLAQAGFYYANNGDEVVCYCCGKRSNYWEETDNPMAVHQRLNPYCSFLLRNDEVNVKIHAAGTNGHVSEENARISYVTSLTGSNNILSLSSPNSENAEIAQPNSENAEIATTSNSDATTGGNDTESTSSSTRRQSDVSRSHGGFVMQTQGTRLPSAEVTQEQTTDPAPTASSPGATANGTSKTKGKAKKVKFPNYVDASKRRATFEDSKIIISISNLVEAGLFYTGYGDCCRCHSCGIGLRHWSVEDDPWVEHARWSKDCDFLKAQKGQEFVDLVQMALRISQNENESSSNGDVDTANANQTSSEIDSLLHGSAAQSLLEMGYSTDLIRQALRAVLDGQGRSAITAVTLTEKVFEIENQGSQSSTASSNMEGTVVKSQDGTGTTGATSGASSGATSGPISGATSGAHRKSQLLEQKRLARENAILKEQSICTICKRNAVCIVFLPCGHLVTCELCAPLVKYCNLPECGKYIKGTVRTYFS